MRSKILNRTLGILVSVFILCASVPAQLTFGPRRLVSVPAPSLRNRTRLRVGLPRLGFVGRIGGIAFDGIAVPAKHLAVKTIALNYSPTQRNGQRLSVTINGQSVSAPIYDWQLLPIANFANSPFYSCFTLFGNLEDAERQERVVRQGGRILNYHPDFRNTLMGLRLFQLDSLIIDKYSYDLVKNGDAYLLGAGESAPTEENRKGLEEFNKYREQNKKLFNSYVSYVISDYRRQVIFDVQGDELVIQGEPSYYFWAMDKAAFTKLRSASDQVEKDLLIQIQDFTSKNPAASTEKWLINQLILEAGRYDQLIGNNQIVAALGLSELVELLSTNGRVNREALLSQQSLKALLKQLVGLRILASILSTKEVNELSEKVSNQTAMLRAINPAVWDAGVNLLRYAAFFRYCKTNNPKEWAHFMRQIARAPAPHPTVITPDVMEGPSR